MTQSPATAQETFIIVQEKQNDNDDYDDDDENESPEVNQNKIETLKQENSDLIVKIFLSL